MAYSKQSLRERAATVGLHTLADVETLALFLEQHMGEGAEATATALLSRFGTMARVVAAPLPELVAVVGPAPAVSLKLLHEAARRILEAPLWDRPILSGSSALADYLKHDMANLGRERFRVLFLDKKNQLLADEIMGEGTVDHAPVYPREIIRRALELNAAALILVHNHPSGDPAPSSADIATTRQVIDAARALGVSVHDHLVVGSKGVASLKALGLI